MQCWTHLPSVPHTRCSHISRRCYRLHGKFLCSLHLQGEMGLKWLENKPHQRSINRSSLNFHLLGPSAIPYWHSVGKGTSVLWQLFLCCPVFAIRTGPRKTFCSWFCTAHPVSAEFIERKKTHESLSDLSKLEKIFYYSPIIFILKYFSWTKF